MASGNVAAKCCHARNPLPFTLDRSSRDSLSGQLAGGLRAAIQSGYYAPGDVLPSQVEMAKWLSVSEIVARLACRRLMDEGMIVSRARLGSVVLPARTPVWRGHVLFVMTDFDFNFMQSGIVSTLREQLTRSGYSFSQTMALRRKDRTLDLLGLEDALRRPVDFVVQCFTDEGVSQRLKESRIPFVVVRYQSDAKSPDGSVGTIDMSKLHAIRDFVDKCRKRHVETVEIVCCERLDGCVDSMMRMLENAGITPSARWLGRLEWGIARMETAERKGYDFAKKNLCRKGFRLPGLYYVTDDYIARGMLTAFSECGVLMPDDVRFVCVARRGARPVYGKSIAVVESDPEACGREVSRRILAWLSRRSQFPSVKIEDRFVKGETFP